MLSKRRSRHFVRWCVFLLGDGSCCFQACIELIVTLD